MREQLEEDEEEELRRNVAETQHHWIVSPYYDAAEPLMDAQWSEIIYRLIKECDFRCVLELAPGHGRNSAKLAELSEELHLVDVNETCIEACRKRFEDHRGPCRIHFHVNDGHSLPMIADDTVTLVYSWDSMVHFAPPVIRRYLIELSRVMRPGAYGALHYSNYAALVPDASSDWRANPHWRAAMSRELFHRFATEAGLVVVSDHILTWGGYPDLDCGSLIYKP